MKRILCAIGLMLAACGQVRSTNQVPGASPIPVVTSAQPQVTPTPTVPVATETAVVTPRTTQAVGPCVPPEQIPDPVRGTTYRPTWTVWDEQPISFTHRSDEYRFYVSDGQLTLDRTPGNGPVDYWVYGNNEIGFLRAWALSSDGDRRGFGPVYIYSCQGEDTPVYKDMTQYNEEIIPWPPATQRPPDPIG